MPTDRELFVEYKVNYKNLSGGEAAKILAKKYGLNHNSVRGRLSRADTPENRTAVAKGLLRGTVALPSIVKQEEIVERSKDKFREWKEAREGKATVGYFISDMHRGTNEFRHDYWELTQQILDDEKEVHAVSVGNDWMDNNGYGRWTDVRNASKKLWSGDLQNAFNIEDFDYQTLDDICGDQLMKLYLAGNHDLWLPNHWRENDPQSAELNIANRMKELDDLGVLMFNRMSFQNAIHLSPALVWEHGTSAAKRATGRARRTMTKYMRDGIAKSVVVGHSHSPVYMKGKEIDIIGVDFVNAGTFYDKTAVEYSKDGAAQGWGGAIVKCQFDTGSREHSLELIEFNDTDNGSYAIVNGKRYEARR